MLTEPTAPDRILIVDDEVHLRAILERVLVDEGYDVTTAENGNQAIGLIRFLSFELVITDLVMRDVNGIDVLLEALKIDPDYPVIVITAYPSKETAVKLVTLGATDYIAKPFSINTLVATVAKVLEQNRNTGTGNRKSAKGRSLAFDRLTNSYSPELFSETLQKEIGRSKMREHTCSLVVVELDNVESYKGSRGRVLFDELVSHISATIRSQTRPGDTLGRLGDARFALILPETERSNAVELAQGIIVITDWDWTLSAGVASFPCDAYDAYSLMRAAVGALTSAKKQGGTAVMQGRRPSFEFPSVSINSLNRGPTGR